MRLYSAGLKAVPRHSAHAYHASWLVQSATCKAAVGKARVDVATPSYSSSSLESHHRHHPSTSLPPPPPSLACVPTPVHVRCCNWSRVCVGVLVCLCLCVGLSVCPCYHLDRPVHARTLTRRALSTCATWATAGLPRSCLGLRRCTPAHTPWTRPRCSRRSPISRHAPTARCLCVPDRPLAAYRRRRQHPRYQVVSPPAWWLVRSVGVVGAWAMAELGLSGARDKRRWPQPRELGFEPPRRFGGA